MTSNVKDTTANENSAFNYKRLLKDVKHIYKEPLHDHGIYYYHNDENFTEGYALIIGPSESFYKHGCYFFKFSFPNDYPFSPPKVEFLTQGYNVRFNPNLYRNGKVCLSILNTWKGEQWTSCQNINSVLLTIAMHCFTTTPLLNEPGVTKKHKDYKIYNDIIELYNYKVGIIKCLKNSGFFEEKIWNVFYPYIKKYISTNKDIIIEDFSKLYKKKLEDGSVKLDEDNDNKEVTLKKWCGVYSMKQEFNYTATKKDLEKTIKTFLN
tara:strand:- start:487 stop:1281 length:795 start_codon:yes stop_codon:yes gene_type:complete